MDAAGLPQLACIYDWLPLEATMQYRISGSTQSGLPWQADPYALRQTSFTSLSMLARASALATVAQLRAKARAGQGWSCSVLEVMPFIFLLLCIQHSGQSLHQMPHGLASGCLSLQSSVFYGGSALLSGVNAITPHLAGAVDIMVVEQPDKSYKSSPFYGELHTHSHLAHV